MFKKITALALAALCFAGALSGCAQKNEKAMWIADKTVYMDEYNIYLNNEKAAISAAKGADYESVKKVSSGYKNEAGEEITFEEIATKNAQTTLVFNKTAELMFEKRGMKYDSATKKIADDIWNEKVKAAGGKANYLKSIKAVGLSEGDQRKYFKARAINSALSNALYGDNGETPISPDDVEFELKTNYYIIKPIYIYKTNEAGMKLPEAQLKEKTDKYAKVQERIKGGEDFEPVMFENNEAQMSDEAYNRGLLISAWNEGNQDIKQIADMSEMGVVVYGETDAAYIALKKMDAFAGGTTSWAGEQAKSELQKRKFEEQVNKETEKTAFHFYVK